MRSCWFIILFLTVFHSWGQLPLRLPSILSNHAVLQQNAEVKLWGWGPGGMNVAIVCSWNSADTVWTKITPECDWSAVVKTPSSGKENAIQFICGKQKIEIKDVVFGEVWLCSGQSNMEFNAKWGVTDAGSALENCDNNEIRFFQVEQSYNRFPQTDCVGEWKICDKTSMSSFSSVGYFFGRKLNAELREPVGLIGAYWGGTCIQPWMPKEIFSRDAEFRKLGENIEPYGWAPEGASVLYNAMIFPVASFKIAGVIWYQGEANVVRGPESYSKLFTAMIGEWRKAFSSDFPFYFVQIAPWNGYAGIDAAYLREQQELALKMPNTGMISVADLVDDVSNIHPGKKRDVGERLANLALKEQYGQTGLQPYSPHFNQLTIKGSKAFVSVTSIGKLRCEGTEIKSFQMAGTDRQFYPATATLEKDGRIQLVSSKVKNPVVVRYCFTNDATSNLADVNNLPLLPFRTDKW